MQTSVRRYRVTGRVQGVGFRGFVESRARMLGIEGWVRNRGYGSVEVLAAGSEEQLGALRSALDEGPRGARVEAVREEVQAGDGEELMGFRVEGTVR